eukprot:snap_masked-scaffold_28-processed-gene-4.12-mRNA-1 protein AED:1.00 eAED:1.00 QI:0/0/0/0/1/1/2/0/171
MTFSEEVEKLFRKLNRDNANSWKVVPRCNGKKDEFRQHLKLFWADLKKREKEVEDELCKASFIMTKINKFAVVDGNCVFTDSGTNNLIEVENRKLNFIGYLWKVPEDADYLNGRDPYDVIVADPPWETFSDYPVWGPAVDYRVMTDSKIAVLNLRPVMNKGMVFVWIIRRK